MSKARERYRLYPIAVAALTAALTVALGDSILGPLFYGLAAATTAIAMLSSVPLGSRDRTQPARLLLHTRLLGLLALTIGLASAVTTPFLFHDVAGPYRFWNQPLPLQLARLAVFLAITAVVEIRLAPGPSRPSRAGWVAILLSAYAPLIGPMYASDRAHAVLGECRGSMRALMQAMQLYMTGTHGVYPPAERWRDLLSPHSDESSTIQCPAATNPHCSYAYNSALSHVMYDNLQNPAETIVIFESDAGWNAAGGPELLPEEHRHLYAADNYGLADGIVRTISRKEVGVDRHGNPMWAKEPNADVTWEPVLKESEAEQPPQADP